jgi:hypothetical protein
MPDALRVSRHVHERFFDRFRGWRIHAFYVCAHGHGQHLCHRVQSVACSGFLTVADIKCDVGATRGVSDAAKWWGADRRYNELIHGGCPMLFFSVRA